MFALFPLLLNYWNGNGERQTKQNGMNGNTCGLTAPRNFDGGGMKQALGDYVIHLEALNKSGVLPISATGRKFSPYKSYPNCFLPKKSRGKLSELTRPPAKQDTTGYDAKIEQAASHNQRFTEKQI